MGQYHLPVNLDKHEFIHPHALGDGLKLMEWGESGFGTAMTLGLLLGPEGRWAGDRIAVIGDYSEPGDLSPEIEAELGDAGQIYGACSNARYKDQPEFVQDDVASVEFTDLSGVAAQLLVGVGAWKAIPADDDGYVSRRDITQMDKYVPAGPECVIVNVDRDEALDPAEFGDSRQVGAFVSSYGGGAMTALTVLLSCSNGRGGGDFRTQSEWVVRQLVGRWCGNRIAILPVTDELVPGAPWNALSKDVRKALADAGEGTYEADGDRVVRIGWDKQPIPTG